MIAARAESSNLDSLGRVTGLEPKINRGLFAGCLKYNMTMRKISSILSAFLVLLPIITIFAFDAQFLGLQKQICAEFRNEKYISYGCNDPELTQRERIISTAFYRHIAGYFGREEGTSPSWLDSAANSEEDSGLSYSARSKIKHELGNFNRNFAVAMLASIIISSVSGTLLVQRYRSARNAKKSRVS